MGKLLVFILGAAILMGVAYNYMQRGAQDAAVNAQTAGPSAPKQTLDNVHRAADRIEAQGQQQADKAAAEPKE